MKIEHTEVAGFRAALRGMRNPFDSWEKSDTTFPGSFEEVDHDIICRDYPEIGPGDMKLCRKLIKAGGDHRKFLRMIVVWADLSLPRYVWQELDTYKVATVRNSCSTMNKLGVRSLEPRDFDPEIPEESLERVNMFAALYRRAKHDGRNDQVADYRVHMKSALPEGYVQTSTYLLNYEVALRIVHSRGSHRLPHWRIGCHGSICEWLLALPYMAEFHQATKR